MNAKIIATKVLCRAAASLILLSAFLFSGRAQAQVDRPPTQVPIESRFLQTSPQTSRELGTDNLLITTPPVLQPIPLFAQNFAGFRNPQTLPLGGVEILEGFDFNYRQQTRDDVERT